MSRPTRTAVRVEAGTRGWRDGAEQCIEWVAATVDDLNLNLGTERWDGVGAPGDEKAIELTI
jgi:hypothetical protein